MERELFEIEFQVPGKDWYITFELYVEGCWKIEEIGGGDMGECLVIEEACLFEPFNHNVIEQSLIKNWVDTNAEAIRVMFTERIKKYED